MPMDTPSSTPCGSVRLPAPPLPSPAHHRRHRLLSSIQSWFAPPAYRRTEPFRPPCGPGSPLFRPIAIHIQRHRCQWGRLDQQLTSPSSPNRLGFDDSIQFARHRGADCRHRSRLLVAYPYYQQLNLQEHNGYEVQLTRFLDGGNDHSSAIASWFGSWRLAPFGSSLPISAGIFRTAQDSLYEVDGTDTAGNKVAATLSVTFKTRLPARALSPFRKAPST